jgi:type IV conjugative transfer system protein TraL
MAEYAPQFPRYMSAPAQILWFEIDQIVVAAICFTFALFAGGWIIWTVFFAIQILFAKTKNNRPRGFLQHLVYMLGFSKIARYPGYFESDFNE